MCLFIGKQEKIILKKDLIVYKQFYRYDSRGYIIPAKKVLEDENIWLIPSLDTPQISSGDKRIIHRGVIFADLHSRGDTRLKCCPVYKAIIPAGEGIWIQDDLNEIAATKLFVTSEQVTTKEKTDLSEFIDIFGSPILLKNGSIQNITEDFDPQEVIGICVTPERILAKDIFLGEVKFSSSPLMYWNNTYSSSKDAYKDLSGKENCRNLKRRYKYNNLQAIEKASELGGYLPSLGELHEALTNLLGINFTRKKLGLPIIPLCHWFWTSTIRDAETIWRGNGYGDSLCLRLSSIHGSSVIPFLDGSNI